MRLLGIMYYTEFNYLDQIRKRNKKTLGVTHLGYEGK